MQHRYHHSEAYYGPPVGHLKHNTAKKKYMIEGYNRHT